MNDDLLELRMWRDGNIMHENCLEDMKKLKAERDEARRRACEDAIRNGRVYRRVGSDTVRCETSKEVAEMMGWDCYKENKENTND